MIDADREGILHRDCARALHPLLQQWIDLTKRYFADKSRPQRWNNEKTFVGHLAAAAWSLGDHALEEYTAPKSRHPDSGKGRVDLWFRLGDLCYVAEAKKCWLWGNWLRSSDETRRAIDASLGAAEDAAGDSPAERGSIKLALVFAPVWIRPEEKEDATRLLDNFVKGIQNCQPDFAAWVFPPEGLTFDMDGQGFHAGTAIVGRVLPEN